MSQEKVDRYKEMKKNRDTIRKKKKHKQFLTRLLWTIILIAIVALLVVWIALSVTHSNTSDSSAVTSTGSYTFVPNAYTDVNPSDYMNTSSNDTETSETETTEAETTESEAVETAETQTTETAQ